MPLMYRPGGVKKFFRSIKDGEKSGFYKSYNAVAKAARAGKLKGAVKAAPQATVSVDVTPPAPPPPITQDDPEKPAPVLDDNDDTIPSDDPAPSPAPVKATRPLPDMELGEVKEHAKRFGLDTTVHHMTLRAQVEERLNAESGNN